MKLPKLLLVTLLMLLPLATRAQKAFEEVIYKGEIAKHNIRLSYADGYLGGCVIKVTDTRSRKVTHFTPEFADPDEHHQLNFTADNQNPTQDHIVLDAIDQEHRAPKRIKGRCYFARKAYPFVLVR